MQWLRIVIMVGPVVVMAAASSGALGAWASPGVTSPYFPVQQSGDNSGPPPVSFTVNSTLDEVDANPGNGICASAAGRCTLRAAIMETNLQSGRHTINVPAGT